MDAVLSGKPEIEPLATCSSSGRYVQSCKSCSQSEATSHDVSSDATDAESNPAKVCIKKQRNLITILPSIVNNRYNELNHLSIKTVMYQSMLYKLWIHIKNCLHLLNPYSAYHLCAAASGLHQLIVFIDIIMWINQRNTCENILT